MRILLVEDDRMLGQAVSMALKDAAYAVDWVRDGAMASSTLSTQHYDMVLLDLGLPKQDGLSVLAQLRKSGLSLPVLILTARDGVQDRIQGLDMGADDYLVKPFEVGELLARMRALTRRQAGSSVDRIGNDTLWLDIGSRTASHQGQSATLTAREFALLRALLTKPGCILSRSELEDRLYGWNEEVESNAVEVLIHAIRKKLGTTAIQNVRGMGWMVPK